MITFEGVIEEIVFSNEANGYTVCDIKSGKSIITAVGFMPFINIGEMVTVSGKWVTHPDYGEQLKVETYEKLLPKTRDAIEKYLGSGLIKGVGPATAKKIVRKFGEETLNILQFQPEKLSTVKGINFDKALRIGQAYKEQKNLRDVVIFLQDYGISPAFCAKIYKIFGEKTVDEIRSNPYRLSDEVFGIGFKAADNIARNLGIDPESKYRIASGIKYVLSQALLRGHTFLKAEELKEQTCNLLNVQIESIDNELVSLTLNKIVSIERENETRVYLTPFYNAEVGVCRMLAMLSSVQFNGDISDFEERIKEVQDNEGIVLAKRQKEAIKEALINGVMVITGGPGTGKTTIIKTIIKLLDKEGYKVVLGAPTGRAAKRMSEATGFEAKTIHRLLEIGYSGNDEDLVFAKTETNPIEADVVIIDEMSMVDILLMNHLLKAIPQGTRLILVGDVDQLPSVGAGNVLGDIIKSGMINSVRLTEIFRQAEESMIILNAHKINSGEFPILNKKDKDFYFVGGTSLENIARTVVELYTKRIPGTYGYDPVKQIQVLTPMRKGITGVANLNIELQSVMNPPSRNKKERASKDFVFREGDRVMQIKNNYNLKWQKEGLENVEGEGVFNGDMGIIKEIDKEEQKLVVEFDDDKVVEYDFSILDELEPAYAVTIHKSQGSEFPVVILPVFQGPPVLMTRNLLYTAVTRAKDLVILVGNKECITQMITNQREANRNSDLKNKLRTCFLGIE